MISSKLKHIFKKYNHKDETIQSLLKNGAKSEKYYGATKPTDDESVLEIPSTEKSIKYPVGVYFVLVSKFLESFAANGVRSILALYLYDAMHFSRDQSTIILHIFNFFSQFCPIIGAFIADGYIGNQRSILYFCLIYTVGFLGITLTTLPIVSKEDSASIIVYLSLWLIAVGNGSIRANITSLGANQFKLPEQNKELDKYFSRYYFVYSLGILLSKTVTPSIRGLTKCFDEDNCYLAVFGTLSVIFLLCFVVFLLGLIFYVKDTHEHNAEQRRQIVLFKVIRCIFTSLQRKFLTDKEGKFLDNVHDLYEMEFVNNVRLVLHIIKLFAPLPIYWSLLAQQDSSWTFQATKLNTNISHFYLEPDQMKSVAPLMIVALIPLWDSILLPAVEKYTQFEITPVASMTLGGISAAGSFICAGFLEIMVQRAPELTISVLWQLPQFFLLMIGEVLLSIPGIQFAFLQAPQSMKTVLTAFWFINNAFGNLIVVFITELKPVKNDSLEYFLYAGLMMIGILIFMIFARHFQERENPQRETV